MTTTTSKRGYISVSICETKMPTNRLPKSWWCVLELSEFTTCPSVIFEDKYLRLSQTITLIGYWNTLLANQLSFIKNDPNWILPQTQWNFQCLFQKTNQAFSRMNLWSHFYIFFFFTKIWDNEWLIHVSVTNISVFPKKIMTFCLKLGLKKT